MLNLRNAYFTDDDEFPVLLTQGEDFKRPFQMIRFSDRKDVSLNDAICFYEWDRKFNRRLEDNQLSKLIFDFKRAGSIVQPDYSIFADDPLILQKLAVFNKNRVAYELQSCGIEVIPNLRWGDERSFDFAFAGIPKHQVCAIGTYGQIRDKEKRYLFEAGLEQALIQTEPKEILIYGSMPSTIFGPYQSTIAFYQYNNWRSNAFAEKVI
ncbi:DUF4417 domain-containing protein [Limosilactobacillus fastidiosus]|uniref:DUF4417 domain-containing protein n=1 Tax=Limosilactobacillus fastidiosus TaxID=2759855 RepID=A0A7W3TZD1_9LACO|nr:DUF4417 domain-containing protein [Limosilactobacillus fastidiosus]MBB1086029.1 DUF4417 domain-containing protein [Limosilactobacillus fastidiosus]MCD7085634.1 DUF4417 domain-containing protein [Limosilactobacillus fastidiosus]MCD7114158.1 DUF4417 domain-containing protein [Limosilactobacillus fastidiosus]MCD7116708.1 DUF4417 domain-containing protein [Limosilactobacillus fastidiosus]